MEMTKYLIYITIANRLDDSYNARASCDGQKYDDGR